MTIRILNLLLTKYSNMWERERERERERVNTWPKQKTGTRGWPISMAKRTNPLLVLRKAIYKGGMTVNPQFNHKKREEMVPLHSYLCMCVHERERERQGGWGCLWSKFNATKLRWLFNQESAQYCLFDFFPTNDVEPHQGKGPFGPTLGE